MRLYTVVTKEGRAIYLTVETRSQLLARVAVLGFDPNNVAVVFEGHCQEVEQWQR